MARTKHPAQKRKPTKHKKKIKNTFWHKPAKQIKITANALRKLYRLHRNLHQKRKKSVFSAYPNDNEDTDDSSSGIDEESIQRIFHCDDDDSSSGIDEESIQRIFHCDEEESKTITL